jgi:hypothetical protein
MTGRQMSMSEYSERKGTDDTHKQEHTSETQK